VAKVRNPLHSISASGSIGESLSFRATRGGSVAAHKPKPYPQSSPNMIANQQRMVAARAAFIALSPTDLQHWQATADARGRPVWLEFFFEYQIQFITAPGAPLIPQPYLS